MPRNVAPGLNAAYSISNAFIRSTTTSEPYWGCFFSILLCTLATLLVLPWIDVTVRCRPAKPPFGYDSAKPRHPFSSANLFDKIVRRFPGDLPHGRPRRRLCQSPTRLSIAELFSPPPP